MKVESYRLFHGNKFKILLSGALRGTVFISRVVVVLILISAAC